MTIEPIASGGHKVSDVPGKLFLDFRADLTRHLSICRDEDFLLLIFAQNAVQSGNLDAARLIFRYGFPAQFANAKMPDMARAHEWELETIANEFFTTSSTYRWVYASHPRLNHESSMALIHIVNLLCAMENEEYAYHDHQIRNELRRIVNRQFEWQRGFFNKASAYRTAVMYGGTECEQYLRSTLGVSLDQISFGAFALYAAFQSYAQVDRRLTTDHVGLPHEVRDIVFDLFSADLRKVRFQAREQRQKYRTTAYRPSILRKFPCIRRSDNDRLMICPLPELIMARATTGIFYDVIPGGGPIKNEVGRRFEDYCLILLSRCYPDVSFEPEFSYMLKTRQDSCDILVSINDEISHIYECKAVRMSLADRYSESEFSGRGYDEIAKAVFQIWRFASHCRRGLSDRRLAKNPIGMVVLLDSWMTMIIDAKKEVMDRAKALAAKGDKITEIDQIPVLFAEIGDLENLVMSVKFPSYVEVLRKALTKEYEGWLLNSIFQAGDYVADQVIYPFPDLGQVVPWWGRIEDMKRLDKR